MLIYVLKSAACLAILLAFYKFLMERESMHTLKRFYLLGILATALTIPFVTFVEYVEIPVPTEIATMEVIKIPAMTSHDPEQTPVDYLPIVLWGMYLLGTFLYGFKFVRNLAVIIQRIRKNPKYRVHHIYNVLLSESIVPHTFLSYIFLNKQKFEARQIPKEVILHEETHAKQKHSWDVLFIEFLQIIFWFNPLIHLTKKAIKLNHEFLADQAVLNKGFKPTTYQNILLEFSSNPFQPSLANAINYSSIKKRFTVMKTQTSKKSIYMRSVLLLPVLVILLYGFSDIKVIQTQQSETQISSEQITPSQANLTEKGKYYEKVTFKFKDKNGNINRQVKYSELSLQEKSNLLSPPKATFKIKRPFQKDLNDWKDQNKFGVWIDGIRIDNIKLSAYSPEDFGTFHISKLAKNAKNYGKHFFQINLYTNKGHIRQFEQSRLPLSDQAIIYLPYRDKSNRTTKAELQTSTSTIKNDSLKFIKDWYITIDEKKYYYLRDKDRVWHYYDSTKKEVKLDIVAEYKKKHNVYNTLKNSGTHYIHKSKNEQMLLELLFSDLGGMVFRMSRANRPKIKRPISPYAPYMKLVKNGQTVFKKPSELTDEDKKLIPPPPPADTVIIYNRLANTIKTLPRNRNANLNYLRKIHSEMNNAQKSKVEHPDSVLKSISQDGATKLQIKEYNTLAKKYNAMSKDDFRIIGKEVNRLKQVYGLMSDKQKKKAEPFPNFPPPPSSPKVTKQIKSNIPPPIPPIKPPTERTKYSDELLDAFDKLMEEGNLYGQAGIAYSKKGKGSIKDLQQKYKEVMKLYETYVKLAVKENLMRPTYSKPRKIRKGDRSNIPPPPPPSHVDGEIIEVPSSSAAPSILNGEIIEVPPSPPSPKSPEEHVMEMAKKDALFYFEGKKISSDKALEILKKSKKINLWTRHEGLKRPIVELSTESYFRPIPNN